jgi:hypothetical protein
VSFGLNWLYGGRAMAELSSRSGHRTTAASERAARMIAEFVRTPGYDRADLSAARRAHESGSERGDFALIDADRIDVPEAGTETFDWTCCLPGTSATIFGARFQADFASPFEAAVREAGQDDLPCARTWALPGHYDRVVRLAAEAGMLKFSLIETEDPAYTSLADRLVMTLFGVGKDETHDRLICWPRVQNALMPAPSGVDLPDPSAFARLRIPSERRLGAFVFDIRNMFHVIWLPDRLSRYFVWPSISFGNLSGADQASLAIKAGRRPNQRALVRPTQCTTPMGWKWSVFIAQSLAEHSVRAGLAMARRVARMPKFRVVRVVPGTAPLHVESGDLLVCHVLDDVNVVGVDLSDQVLSRVQVELEGAFERRGLLVKREKSTEIGTVVRDRVTFIGLVWDLQRGIIRPRPENLAKLARVVEELLATGLHAESLATLESAVGLGVWTVMCRRGALSALFHVYDASLRSDCVEGALNAEPLVSPSLWQAAVDELRVICHITPLIFVRTARVYWSTVVACFAGPEGAFVAYARLPVDAVEVLASGADGCARTCAPSCSHVTAVQQEGGRGGGGPGWRLAFLHPWRKPGVLQTLASAAAVLAADWIATHPSAAGKRVVLLVSDRNVAAGIVKGRSSIPGLAVGCRKIAAICLAQDILLDCFSVPKDGNPAAHLSRGQRHSPPERHEPARLSATPPVAGSGARSSIVRRGSSTEACRPWV